MIFKTASPVSPDVQVAIDSVPVNYLSLQRISLEEKENTHGLMVLDFTGLSPELITEYIDKPVMVNISFPNLGDTTFTGYVVYLEPVSVTKDGLVNSSPFQIVRMYCLSASYVMKSRRSRVWEGVTLPDIVKNFSDSYKFSMSVPQDSYRFKRLTQSGQSDWEFLTKVAGSLGYSVFVEGTHIHVWDPFQALGRRSSYGILKTLRGLNGNVTPNVGQVLRFEGRIGAVSTSGSRTLDTLHILDKDGKTVSVGNATIDDKSGLGTTLESRFNDTLPINADTYEMAYKLVHGRLRKKFPLSAVVDITGNPTLHPGGIVLLDKYDAEFDGFWYIVGVRHELTRSELVTILELAKDSIDGESPLITGSEYLRPPAPTLINATWVSERVWENVYS